MNKNTSYKQMIRDRCPRVVNFALKWCKAKEKWLNYVYKEQIWILASKKERLKQTKVILGIAEDGKSKFNFHNTICWKELSVEDTTYWKYVESWVDFFTKKYAYIQNMYTISVTCGKSIEDCKWEMMTMWLLDLCPKATDSEETIQQKNKYVNELTDYLIACFEGNIN